MNIDKMRKKQHEFGNVTKVPKPAKKEKAPKPVVKRLTTEPAETPAPVPAPEKKKKPAYKSVPWHDGKFEKKERLPDGSTFAVCYSASGKCWIGTLTILEATGEPLVFRGQESGVFRLLHTLDGLWRKHLAESTDGPQPA